MPETGSESVKSNSCFSETVERMTPDFLRLRFLLSIVRLRGHFWPLESSGLELVVVLSCVIVEQKETGGEAGEPARRLKI